MDILKRRNIQKINKCQRVNFNDSIIIYCIIGYSGGLLKSIRINFWLPSSFLALFQAD